MSTYDRNWVVLQLASHFYLYVYIKIRENYILVYLSDKITCKNGLLKWNLVCILMKQI